MSSLNKVGLLSFLEWAADKGMMKKATAMSLKGACNNVLSVLEESEADDLSTVDWDSVFQRWENLHASKVSPGTMRAYRQRVKYAFDEFGKYIQNRSGWRPSGGQRSTSPGARSKKSGIQGRVDDEGNYGEVFEIDDASKIVHHFPLRRNIVVAVTGIPFDVKKAEMARLTAYLSNLVPEEEIELSRPMLNPSPDEVD